MITLRKATLSDYEIYKSMFENFGLCWLSLYCNFKISEDEEKNTNTSMILDKDDLAEIDEEYNLTYEKFKTKLKTYFYYIYIVECNGSVVGYVDIDYCGDLEYYFPNGKKFSGSKYHIGEFGLLKTVSLEQKIELIRLIKELDLPNRFEIDSCIVDTPEGYLAFESNDFKFNHINSKYRIYNFKITYEEMVIRTKEKKKKARQLRREQKKAEEQAKLTEQIKKKTE